MTAAETISNLVGKYEFPIGALQDMNKRIGDWAVSETNRNDDDPYLWQQVRFLNNCIEYGYARKIVRY